MAESYEEKQRKFEEQQFKKRWGNFLKKCPSVESVSANVGRAPACNTRGPKKEIAVTVDNKKKKK